jgi:6,7-dimethyl-8-ribityllumazine synthase
MPQYQGQLDAHGMRFGIVAGRFNDAITDRLVDAARSCLLRHGADDGSITLVTVPGAFEIPLACQQLAQSGEVDAVIALGAVIRGATPHFDHVAGQCASGVQRVALDTGVPVVFGVLTTDTIEQAVERAGTKAGNKGFDAALAAIDMVDVLRQLPKAAAPLDETNRA